MTTFDNTYGPSAMLSSVSQMVASVEAQHDVEVHTISLILNGQHGEFDLMVGATDDDLEDHTFEGIAHRYGGVAGFKEV